MRRKIVIIAGPNGAGKTTFAREYLPREAGCPVSVRVAQGGHSVPQNVIRRRFEAGRRNFERVYRHLVDAWVVYDNSGETPVLSGEGANPRAASGSGMRT